MKVDWNWFFSALAQSTAAIVGLIGAFVFTKIVNNQAAFAVKKEQIKNCLTEAETLRDKASTIHFDWYNERMREEALEELKKRLQEEGVNDVSEGYYKELWFSIYDDRGRVIDSIKEAIEEHRRAIEESQQDEASSSSRSGQSINRDSLISNILKTIPPLREFNLEAYWRLQDAINQERERINALWIDVCRHCRAIEGLLQEIRSNPYSSRLINGVIVALMLLFYGGVVYPLALLPHAPEANIDWLPPVEAWSKPKVVALVFISLLFTAVSGVFLYINRSLKFDPKDIERLEEYQTPEAYSPYFKNRVENERFLAARRRDRT